MPGKTYCSRNLHLRCVLLSVWRLAKATDDDDDDDDDNNNNNNNNNKLFISTAPILNSYKLFNSLCSTNEQMNKLQ